MNNGSTVFQLMTGRIAKLVGCLMNPVFLHAVVAHRVAAGIEHRQALRQFPFICTVIDVGANRGQFSLAVRRWAPGARVVAFEPLAGPAARFRKVFEGDSRVRLHRAAIGPETGEATMHVSAADDSSSLLPISKVQERLFPGTGEVRTETVRVGRLSEFVSAQEIVPPALLKLDVQGFELEALKGCEDLLARFSYLYAECSFVELYSGQSLADKIIDWLRDRMFVLNGVFNVCYDKVGQAIQGDFLFQRKPSHSPSS